MIRRAAAALAIAALGAAALRCTAILGVDTDPENVVTRMCACDELRFLGDPAACQATLHDRFERAQDTTRSAWLAAYVDHPCTHCDKVLYCYYQLPTCASLACTTDEECCGPSAGQGGTCDHDAGVCNHPQP